ncbi:MAG TPA: lipocalin family protein [Myxococcota bacterium]|nr:lipocalin family protein [Myxococcota bacterium]
MGRLFFALLLIAATPGCLTSRGVGPRADAPLETVDRVDLERFAGLWYVIESMPTSLEEGAHDATEHYALREDGDIDITFRFREGAFDGPEEVLEMRGWVHDEQTRAEWRVSPFWPIRLAYLVLELDPDYGHTVIGHPSKRYVWIMSRKPTLDEEILERLREGLAAAGYDVSGIERVPQRPLSERDPSERDPSERGLPLD